MGEISGKSKSAMNVHRSVLNEEVSKLLDVRAGKKYIDATLGAGGHAKQIVKKGGVVLGLEVDPQIISTLDPDLVSSITIKESNFANVDTAARESGFDQVDGILFDLGVSSLQLDTPERGFSFRFDSPLDMRMDPNLSVKAADLVNGLHVGELEKLFTRFGEEKFAKLIAKTIVRQREEKPITSTLELADLVTGVKERFEKHKKIHAATKVFQALRIAVNDELNNLKTALPKAVDLLAKNGCLVVISFHSLEDKIVEDFINQRVDLANLTTQPILPSSEEVFQNPRSRSAKLRAARKI